MALVAALATKTERTRIGTSIVILPLPHPVRLAEDASTVDSLSGGRFMLGVGLGYRPVESRSGPSGARVALVISLRETSMLSAVAIGAVFPRERVGVWHVLEVGVMFGGVVLIRVAGM